MSHDTRINAASIVERDAAHCQPSAARAQNVFATSSAVMV
jgi:hypothetical protein